MLSLAERIKVKLDEKGVSAYKLEKRVGLKRSAINNILYGKSKNPSMDIIQAIARGLNCSIAELIGDGADVDLQKIASEDLEILNCLNAPIQDSTLYYHVLELTGEILTKHGICLPKRYVFSCIEEIYSYSLKRGEQEIDTYFAEWIIEKYGKLHKVCR